MLDLSMLPTHRSIASDFYVGLGKDGIGLNQNDSFEVFIKEISIARAANFAEINR